MPSEGGELEVEIVLYPEGRLLKIEIGNYSITVSDLLKALESVGVPRDCITSD